jgi:hypothetical protein
MFIKFSLMKDYGIAHQRKLGVSVLLRRECGSRERGMVFCLCCKKRMWRDALSCDFEKM